MKDIQFKLLDFQVYDEIVENDDDNTSGSDGEAQYKPTQTEFRIQTFGLDEQGRTYCMYIKDFTPFFFIKVDSTWNKTKKKGFENLLKNKFGSRTYDAISKIMLVERENLYGFDDGKKYKFLLLKFNNMSAFHRVKGMFYYKVESPGKKFEKKLIPDGPNILGTNMRLYESNIPPLLRFFHLRDLSPSGWVSLSKKSVRASRPKRTTCDFEYIVSAKNVKPLPEKEDRVPYKVCSFDIEASSSHGDFPVPVKTYKKLAGNVLDFWDGESEHVEDQPQEICDAYVQSLVECAFGYGTNEYIDKVYPKLPPKDKAHLKKNIDKMMKYTLKMAVTETASENKLTIEDMFESVAAARAAGGGGDEAAAGEAGGASGGNGAVGGGAVDDGRAGISDIIARSNMTKQRQRDRHLQENSDNGIVYFLNSTDYDREEKLDAITKIMDATLPPLEGDVVTFIGSTFLKYGDSDPYLNHCITLNTCDKVADAEIEEYTNEEDVLLAWSRLIQRENPDIIIGYNIFGFDYSFMYYRAKENGMECLSDFLKLSRNKDEICWNKSGNGSGSDYDIERSSITIASGTHNLHFVKMPGRIQIDLYNYFRREYNLTSYKLDYASGHFIGDKVKKLDADEDADVTFVYSKNLTGLKPGAYVHFEEIGHSTEYYADGKKFNVLEVGETPGMFMVSGQVRPDMAKTIRWCLAKDDVTPHDIFRLTNEGPSERAIVAKYCIQDCNLVHHLLRKIDVITGIVEMAKICSVPIDFIIMRGQGIKLFSFIAKQCRDAGVVIPVLERKNDGSYEGAIVLPPKTGLYLNEPVACVDYSSLYPSSMISENLSHDSKVWTKEYDLQGNMIRETGIKDDGGNYVYDNLDTYKYVDVTYDTYEYIRKTPRGAEVKTKVGYKTCRFAQFPDGKLAIMPRILKELLAARKATRASAKWKTVKTSIGEFSGMVLEKTDKHVTMKTKDGDIKIIETQSITSMEDTYDDFMKNVLDKRQLAIKVTANSLYGQCGARTSSFYEKDVAASTTATGRKLLTYGKRIIEEVYGDRICETKYGRVHSHAEYVYGDSVTGDTPVILRHKGTHEITLMTIKELGGGGTQDNDENEDEDGTHWSSYKNFKPHDTVSSNRRFKQQSNRFVNTYDVWTAGGWAPYNRVIRHKCNKSIYRVYTPNSVVDVTEDHSLLTASREIMKPSEGLCKRFVDTPLLHNVCCRSEVERNGNVAQGCYTFHTKIEAARFIQSTHGQGMSVSIEAAANGSYNVTVVPLYQVPVQIHRTFDDGSYFKCTKIVDGGAYDDYVYDIETQDGTFNTGFPLIVKNTDSVFMSFKLTDPDSGEKIVGREALEHTIELAKEAGELATKFLKAPHDLEYEKTFMPFCLLSKKRYVGMLYEEDPDSCYRKSMGIVLKRRDNAPIVKDVYGGIIDILMKDQDVSKAVSFTKQCLDNIVNEKYPLDKLIITKSLRAFYKNPQQIAHKVLADRMGKRDPGNKPSAGDRIPFVYIQTKGKKVLQGDKVEHPEWIRKNKLKPDYTFYITNQIMKPVQQLFGLVLQDIPQFAKQKRSFLRSERILIRKTEAAGGDHLKVRKAVETLRNKEVKQLIFADSLRQAENDKSNQRAISSFFMKF